MSDAGTATAGNGGLAWHQAPEFGDGLPEYAANKGWIKPDPAEAARDVIKSFRELERFRGIPSDEIARLPKRPDDPDWQVLYQRLGAPKDAAGYIFTDVKLPDGSPAPADYIEAMRTLAAEHHLPVATAQAIAARGLDIMEKQRASSSAAAETAAAQRALAEKTALDQEWGADAELHLRNARKAVDSLGFSADFIEKVQKLEGFGTVMKMMASAGSRIAEGATLRGDGTVGQGSLTPVMAEERLAELRKDRAWYVKLTDPKAEGHADAQKLWGELNRASRGPR